MGGVVVRSFAGDDIRESEPSALPANTGSDSGGFRRQRYCGLHRHRIAVLIRREQRSILLKKQGGRKNLISFCLLGFSLGLFKGLSALFHCVDAGGIANYPDDIAFAQHGGGTGLLKFIFTALHFHDHAVVVGA